MVVGLGFEPRKAFASRFTVCPVWPLRYPTVRKTGCNIAKTKMGVNGVFFIFSRQNPKLRILAIDFRLTYSLLSANMTPMNQNARKLSEMSKLNRLAAKTCFSFALTTPYARRQDA